MSKRQPPRSTRAHVRKHAAKHYQELRELDEEQKTDGYKPAPERPSRLILTITASLGNGLAAAKLH